MEGDEGDVLHGDAILDHEFRVGEVIESADPRPAVTLELRRSDGTTLIYGFSRNKALALAAELQEVAESV
jgi:hypothetical protein